MHSDETTLMIDSFRTPPARKIQLAEGWLKEQGATPPRFPNPLDLAIAMNRLGAWGPPPNPPTLAAAYQKPARAVAYESGLGWTTDLRVRGGTFVLYTLPPAPDYATASPPTNVRLLLQGGAPVPYYGGAEGFDQDWWVPLERVVQQRYSYAPQHRVEEELLAALAAWPSPSRIRVTVHQQGANYVTEPGGGEYFIHRSRVW